MCLEQLMVENVVAIDGEQHHRESPSVQADRWPTRSSLARG